MRIPPISHQPVSALFLMLILAITGQGAGGAGAESDGDAPIDITVGMPNSALGLFIPSPSQQGKWVLGAKAGEYRQGYLSETWNWQGEEDGGADFTVVAEYKRQSPPPPASEVARAFSRAASRTSYASTVSDSEISPTEQWVEYTLPMQGEAGCKKIITLSDGYVTLTLANSDKFEEGAGEEEKTTWNQLVQALRRATVSKQ